VVGGVEVVLVGRVEAEDLADLEAGALEAEGRVGSGKEEREMRE
jgi:hypothetical protein